MTKRHFEAIAAILDGVRDDYRFDGAVDAMANRMADYFKSENPRFDRDLFLAACGLS
jgi:hypothetical protein